jgi:(R,R)-butanediol dehydrogenase/meso-butanediol dehydrogenase/diacetyl reductase
MTLQCAFLSGAREVYVSEVSSRRLELAKRLGATAVFNPLTDNLFVKMEERTEGLGPDLIFDCAATPATLQDAITLVRKGGQIFVVGLCEEPVEADFMTVVMNELEIKGGYCGYEEYPLALDYIAQGRVEVDSLVSDVIALDEIVEKGFEVLAAPEPQAIKILVKF